MKNRFFGSDKYKGRKPSNPEERTGERDDRSEKGGDRSDKRSYSDKPKREWNNDRPKRDGERSGGSKEWGSDKPKREWSDKPKREWNNDRPKKDGERSGGSKDWGSDKPKREWSDKPKREWNNDRPKRDGERSGGSKDWGSDKPKREWSDKPKREWNNDRPKRDGERSGGRKDWGSDKPKREWNSNRPKRDWSDSRPASTDIKPILTFEEGENESPRENRGERREWNNDRRGNTGGGWKGGRDRDDRRGGGGGWKSSRDNRDNRDRDNRNRDSDSNDLRPVLDENKYLMYGKHPVLCALQNPKRKIAKIYCSKNSYDLIREAISAQTIHTPVVEVMEPSQIDRLFDRTKDAVVHNGVVAEVEILQTPEIESIAEDYKKIVVLDKITDPHNAGAIIRSCAAFGVGIVLTKEKDSSPENATIAKTSAGYIEKVTYARLSSIQNSIEYLKNQGFKIIGLSGAAEKSISSYVTPERFVLVTGSEGKGLSPNIEALCDELIKIDISAEVESLNASVATAIALYALK